MAKLLSGRLKNLNVGVSSYTENNRVLTATGDVFISRNLSVVGDTNFTGIVTASSFKGDGSQLTGISAGSQWVTNSTGIHTLSNVGVGTTTATSRLTVSGDATFTGVITASSFIGNASLTNLTGTNLNYSGISTFSNARGTNLNFTGVSTLTNATGTNINFTGVGTVATLNTTSLITTRINSSGVSTFSSGPVLISNTGTASSTGTLAQSLQVTGGAYVSGSVGFGTISPREKLDVVGGNLSIQGVSTSNRFYIQHNTSLNSLDFVFI